MRSLSRAANVDQSTEYPGQSTTQYNAYGFELFVSDRSRLPGNISEIDDCPTLWSAGLAAGGTKVRSVTVPDPIVPVNETVTIVAMRAKVTRHVPIPDGVLLGCWPPPGAAAYGSDREDVKVTFNFRSLNIANSGYVSAGQSDKIFPLLLTKSEAPRLFIETSPSVEDIDWHIEADVVIGGEVRTVIINDQGREFRSPGYRYHDDYQEGHSGIDEIWDLGPALDWGVDMSAKTGSSQNGKVIMWQSFSLPFRPGLEIYIPRRADLNRYRQVRYYGRELITFNPPGVEAQQISKSHTDDCWIEDAPGRIRSVDPVRIEIQKHGDQDFEHRTVDFQCNAPHGSQSRDSEDIDSPEYWTCGGSLCNEERYRAQSVRKLDSAVVFKTDIDGPATAKERQIAGEILRSVQER